MKNATQTLKEMIEAKEAEKNNAEIALKQNFNNTLESLNPLNILKNSVTSFINSSNIVNKFIGIAIAAGSGYLLKKVIEKNSSAIMKKLSAMVIEYGVINFITNNKEEIKNTGIKIFNKIFDLNTTSHTENT